MRWRIFFLLLLVGGVMIFSSPPEAFGQGAAALTALAVGEAVGEYFFGEDGADGTVASRMLNTVLCGLKKLVCWGVQYIASMILNLLQERVFEDAPDLSAYAEGFNDMKAFLWFLDGWVPLGWGVVLMSAYVVFVLIVITVKWILKLIPTMG